ncbi:alpha/beta-hydrolase [Penicillium waksmanii]|uniref:alpha/beta-hydrolase n=1 Tax=Penicillium waksmanii TaxID=69791 RepID=UPI002546CD20|nr:alpha/beta-hydrolase [Penicillium waksmanii]KAJ5999945.1 alpha/beta-hydrolase [Penicillium waksmanii]
MSIVQVPFDKKFQNIDNTWQLPLENSKQRGHVRFYNYTSPGSTYPTKNVHVAGVYLPPGYNKAHQYPVLYFHHGRGGNHADWFNQGRLHNIVDRLIDSGEMPPVVIITPNLYNLGFAPEDFATNSTDYHYTTYDQIGIYAFDAAVRENYFKYLMPWVEKTFAVGTLPANRSFVGLSMGGGLATEMLYNATDYFDAYGIFSQVPFVPPVAALSVPAFKTKKLLLGAGLYDFALPSTLNAESLLAQAGVKNIMSHISICGGHSWCVWQELARIFLKDVKFAN